MTTLISLLALGALSAAQAAPYELSFGVTGVSSGSDEWNLTQDLLDQLNSGVVDLDLSQVVGDDELVWEQNGTSQLTFTNDPAILAGFPALAYRWSLGNGDWECDMGVSTDVTYTTTDDKVDSNQYGGWGRTMGSTVMHELGHCIRIGHRSTEYNIMGADFTHVHANGGELYFYMGEDAADRLVALHDVNTDFEDVGVVHWRYAGNPDGDAYSNHERTVVMSASYDELPSYTEDDGDNPVFLVRRGHDIRPEFTFENNGSTNSVQIEVDYLLSTNDLITSQDDWIGATTMSMGRDNVYTTSRSVWVPSWTEPGRYHVGARIADLVDLHDDVSQNNATYIDIDVMANGDDDYCEGPVPCERFEGDCDSDADCGSGLQCIMNQGHAYGFANDLTDVCDLPFGDADYCSPGEPCERFMGDCDTAADCQGGMSCIQNAGAEHGFAAWVDVCDYPVGHASYCSPQYPCGIGEGDCDSNLDCAAGTCRHDVGASYGFDPLVDVCEVGLVLGF
jgi:hypothetical protein